MDNAEPLSYLMERSDECLVGRFRRGQTAALDALVHRHYQQVFHHVLRRVRDADLAHDITQEVFVRVMRALPRFRGESRFSTWLYRVTQTGVIDHHRSIQRWNRLRRFDAAVENGVADAVQDSSPSPVDEAMNQELIEEIKSAVDELSTKQRQVFRMRYLQGLSMREISESLDIRMGTVKSHLFQGKQKVREALADYMADQPTDAARQVAEQFALTGG